MVGTVGVDSAFPVTDNNITSKQRRVIKMIIVTWRFSTTPDGVGKGLEWAKKMSANAKKRGYGALKWWLLRPRTGDASRFSMVLESSCSSFQKRRRGVLHLTDRFAVTRPVNENLQYHKDEEDYPPKSVHTGLKAVCTYAIPPQKSSVRSRTAWSSHR